MRTLPQVRTCGRVLYTRSEQQLRCCALFPPISRQRMLDRELRETARKARNAKVSRLSQSFAAFVVQILLLSRNPTASSVLGFTALNRNLRPADALQDKHG